MHFLEAFASGCHHGDGNLLHDLEVVKVETSFLAPNIIFRKSREVKAKMKCRKITLEKGVKENMTQRISLESLINRNFMEENVYKSKK